MSKPETVWEFYTAGEVAKILKVNRRTIYNWIRAGKLEAIKLDGNYRITSESINKFLGQGGGRCQSATPAVR